VLVPKLQLGNAVRKLSFPFSIVPTFRHGNAVPEALRHPNKVSLPRRLIESGSRPRGRDTFLCSAKEKYPKERRPGCRLNPAFLAFTGGCQKGHPWPSVNVRPPCRTPHGLFPAKAPVLGAANGIQSYHRLVFFVRTQYLRL